MGDRNTYFSTTKRGEVQELKEELASLDRVKKKEAVKKVIAAMTVGKDVSMLFPAVVNNMQTEDLELKKLVYLYLINYAKTQPDLAIMAVNTFVKDSQDPNPLIRALAVRTMGCIRVDKITEYLCDPLQRCLKDEDPYVRKTAAVCVAKLYDINAELVEDRGFLDALKELLSDANPMVVANAVAALAEIQDLGCADALAITPHTLFKLLAALNECTEWGQVFILDALAGHTFADAAEAEKVAERVLPRLQHANSAVVLSAVKVLLRCMDAVSNEELVRAWSKKLAPPLVTLLASEPEVQYVALRSISLIVQRRPGVLANDVRVFFCKYNDPLYVKMEKLEIMVRLASPANVDAVLLELREYAQEVDVDFVRRAVRAVGRVAVALEPAAERCVGVLMELVRSKVSYVVQEAVVVVKDIFRRYANRFESVIGTLCESLDALDEPEAKAAMVWIIGEYAERIDNADELLGALLEGFPEEPASVQLQLLTAAVKLFLKKPTEAAQRMVQLVLSAATTETDNPDLRDRAYVYWRLLSTDPEAAKDVVLAPKPPIADDASGLEPAVLRQLLAQLGSLAAVYHRPADAFVSRQRVAVARAEELQAVEHTFVDTDDASAGGAGARGSSAGGAPALSAPAPAIDLLGGGGGDDDLLGTSEPAAAAPAPAAAAAAAAAAATAAAVAAPAAAAAAGGGLDDLLGDMTLSAPAAAAPAPPAAVPAAAAAAAPAPAPAAAADDDPFGFLGGGGSKAVAAAAAGALPVLLSGDKGRGLVVRGGLARANGAPVYRLELTNGSGGPLDGFMLQLNANALGLAPANQVVAVATLAPGASGSADVPLAVNPAKFAAAPAAAGAGAAPPRLQVALKTAQLGVFYWEDALALPAVLEESGAIDGGAFLASWRALGAEASQQLSATVGDFDAAKAALAAARLFVLAQRPVPGTDQEALYVTGRAPGPSGPTQLLLELRVRRGVPGVSAAFKSARPELAPLVFDAVERALSSGGGGVAAAPAAPAAAGGSFDDLM